MNTKDMMKTLFNLYFHQRKIQNSSQISKKYNQFKPYLSDTFFPDNEQEVTDIRTIISELNDINQNLIQLNKMRK